MRNLSFGAWVALTGCGVWPTVNEPPVLHAVNGVEATRRVQREGSSTIRGWVSIPGVAPGELLELEVDAEDPEGDRFRVWFPGLNGRVDFDPADRTGAILTPDDYALSDLLLELRDEGPDAMGAAYRVWLE